MNKERERLDMNCSLGERATARCLAHHSFIHSSIHLPGAAIIDDESKARSLTLKEFPIVFCSTAGYPQR